MTTTTALIVESDKEIKKSINHTSLEQRDTHWDTKRSQREAARAAANDNDDDDRVAANDNDEDDRVDCRLK